MYIRNEIGDLLLKPMKSIFQRIERLVILRAIVDIVSIVVI
jgi:hypothetical protein